MVFLYQRRWTRVSSRWVVACWHLFFRICAILSRILGSFKLFEVSDLILCCLISPFNVLRELVGLSLTSRNLSFLTVGIFLRSWTCQTSCFTSANALKSEISCIIIAVGCQSKSFIGWLCCVCCIRTLLESHVMLLVTVHLSQRRPRQGTS